MNFHHFCPPWKNLYGCLLAIPLTISPGKNPSETHATSNILLKRVLDEIVFCDWLCLLRRVCDYNLATIFSEVQTIFSEDILM